MTIGSFRRIVTKSALYILLALLLGVERLGELPAGVLHPVGADRGEQVTDPDEDGGDGGPVGVPRLAVTAGHRTITAPPRTWASAGVPAAQEESSKTVVLS